MKLTGLIACFVMLTIFTFGQSSYEVKSLGTNYSIAQFQSAFNSANFCGWHFENKRRMLTFDDGAKIELLSGEELGLSPECILDSNTKLPKCEYAIGNGVILRRCDHQPSTKEEKLNLMSPNN